MTDAFKELETAVDKLKSFLKDNEISIFVDSETTFPLIGVGHKRAFTSGVDTQLGATDSLGDTEPQKMHFRHAGNIIEYSNQDYISDGDDEGYVEGDMRASYVAHHSGLTFGDIINVSTETIPVEEFWSGKEEAEEMIAGDKELGITYYIGKSETLIYLGEAKFININNLTPMQYRALRTTAAILNQEANDALGLQVGTIQELMIKDDEG